MRTFNFTQEAVIWNQDIFDFKNNFMIYIFQEKNQFGFRVFTRNKKTGKKEDVINKSAKEDWAYGPFSSPEVAEDAAREFATQCLKSSV